MPCTHSGSFEGDRLLSCRAELDRVTSYLCALMSVLERGLKTLGGRDDGLNILLSHMDPTVTPEEVMAWWNKHKHEDERKKRLRMATVDRKAPMLLADLGY